jgi:hypothetical protein
MKKNLNLPKQLQIHIGLEESTYRPLKVAPDLVISTCCRLLLESAVLEDSPCSSPSPPLDPPALDWRPHLADGGSAPGTGELVVFSRLI